jgi:hypothetical protein
MKREVISGIYCIEHMESGKMYIGKSNSINSRMRDTHKKCTYLYNALKRHGNDAFCRYIVKYCEPEEMVFWEKYYIKEWNTKSPNGYNLTDGGDGMLGYIPSEATRKLLSEACSGEKNGFYGKHHSEETKEIISKANSGRYPSDETRKLIGDAERGEKNSNYGKSPSSKTRKLMSIAHSGENNYFFGKKRKNALSQYRGVFYIIQIAKNREYIYWRCHVGKKYIGTYKTELEAAKSYDKYIIENNLPNPLNFPEDYNK